MPNYTTIRKQGKCVCEECGKKWTYDHQKIVDIKTLEMGHIDGFTRYEKCKEHEEEI